MPDVNEYDNEKDWMEACIPAHIDEGKPQDQAVAICASQWAEKGVTVSKSFAFSPDDVSTKAGARNSTKDMERLQAIHDMAVENGAMCKSESDKVSIPMKTTDTVFMGSEIKALGDGRVGGYLVRYSDANTPDLTGDFFDADTYLGDPSSVDVYYNHGVDPIVRRSVIGKATLRKDAVGMWAEAQLAMRDEYEKQIYKLAEDGKLGWSSGSAGHLVEREPAGKAYKITRWPIVEASLTPTPAEWRNQAIPLKSLITAHASEAVAEHAADNKTAGNIPAQETTGGIQMDETELKALIDGAVKSAAGLAATEAVKAYAESQATVKAGTLVVTADEADRAASGNPFKGLGEFMAAVATAETRPNRIDIRLLPQKATGANETIPSQGGFLLPANLRKPMIERMYNTGEILKRVNVDPISQGNGISLFGLDETSRADASRDGGILAYWTAEAGSMTSTKPKWREANMKLNDLTALVYATNDMLDDQTYLQSWMSRKVPAALKFKVEDALVNGLGVGAPLGFLGTSDSPGPCLVQVTRTDASKVQYADIVNVWARRWIGGSNYVWLINQDVEPQLLSMTIGSYTAAYLPPGGLSAAPYGTLMGKPVIPVEYMPTLGTLGDITLADLGTMLAIDKATGVSQESSIHVAFVTNETAFRWTYRFDAQPEWNSPLTPYKGSATVSPFVALTASS